LIAGFQFMKAAFLIIVAGFLWLAPDALPNSAAFSQLLVIAAHGKDLSGYLVPVFACYVIYVGVGLLKLRPSIRKNLALSSAITICVSLQRLGVFGDTDMTNQFDRQTLYILILLDLAIYIYLAFHPEIIRCFGPSKPLPPVHS
jgi:hypothetical protein